MSKNIQTENKNRKQIKYNLNFSLFKSIYHFLHKFTKYCEACLVEMKIKGGKSRSEKSLSIPPGFIITKHFF